MRVWTIVVAAGTGERFGGAKQYEVVAGRRLLDWALSAARSVSDGVVVVVDAARIDASEPLADAVVGGGATRSASVRAGLAAVPGEAEVVVVHDAARPCASPALFAAVVDAVARGADAAVPGVAVVDTVKRVDGDGLVTATLERGGLVAVQTPQAFAAGALRAAHAGAGDATDDAALVEAAGGQVSVVAGEPTNAKVTEPGDLDAAAGHLAGSVPSTRRPGRVGLGFDIHPYATGGDGPLVLGGVLFEGERSLVGHSDADVVAHAAAEALLGAAGLDDLGTQFPDSDPRWQGADSVKLLAAVGHLVREAGWAPANVDCSVVLDGPRLAPRRLEMQQRLGAAVGTDVTVRGRRAEGLGALGRGEGIACWAVALLEPAGPGAP